VGSRLCGQYQGLLSLRPRRLPINESARLDYVSTKGAVVGFTKALARELGPEGIRVNCIAPGAFPTDAEKIHPDPEGYNRFVLENQAIKRRGTSADMAKAVLFFASDLSDFVTGQSLLVDGGWAMP
jgi:3-oxoacyl-[acyl-carrier protein] reductase